MLPGMLGLVLAVAAVTGARAGETAEEILERVRAKYATVNDAEVRFSQRVRFPGSRIDQSTSGVLVMKKDNRYRIEIDRQTIVTDGETVWRHTQEPNQVFVDRYADGSRALSPDRILGGGTADMPAVIVGREKLGKGEAVVLKLTPKEDALTVKSLKLWVSTADWLVRRAEIVDGTGVETTYAVTDIRLNAGIPDSRFQFRVPEGAEVVDLR
jgi:outer membrane lipoprotein carrier protein